MQSTTCCYHNCLKLLCTVLRTAELCQVFDMIHTTSAATPQLLCRCNVINVQLQLLLELEHTLRCRRLHLLLLQAMNDDNYHNEQQQFKQAGVLLQSSAVNEPHLLLLRSCLRSLLLLLLRRLLPRPSRALHVKQGRSGTAGHAALGSPSANVQNVAPTDSKA
jgi:hypothetical protein